MMDDKKWVMDDGSCVSVSTPSTRRASQVIQLYNALRNTSITNNKVERFNLLMYLQNQIEDLPHKDVDQILFLISREIEMTQRRRPQSTLNGLRKRIISHYEQLLMWPPFNPEAARFQKIPGYYPRRLRTQLSTSTFRNNNHSYRPRTTAPTRSRPVNTRSRYANSGRNSTTQSQRSNASMSISNRHSGPGTVSTSSLSTSHRSHYFGEGRRRSLSNRNKDLVQKPPSCDFSDSIKSSRYFNRQTVKH